MNKQDELAKCLNEVAASMERLSLMLEDSTFSLNLFNTCIKTTGVQEIDIREQAEEWRIASNNIENDKIALYNCWLKSAVFFGTLTQEFKDRHCLNQNDEMKADDLVFEDGSYITTGVAYSFCEYVVRFYVEISRDSMAFSNFNMAAKYLWENHAKDSYGVE